MAQFGEVSPVTTEYRPSERSEKFWRRVLVLSGVVVATVVALVPAPNPDKFNNNSQAPKPNQDHASTSNQKKFDMVIDQNGLLELVEKR